MRIAVFGLGYVGTVTAAGLASRGHEARGQSPIAEPGTNDLVATGAERGVLTGTTDPVVAMDPADGSLFVGTPSMQRGRTHLTYMRRVLDDIRGALAVYTRPPSGLHAVVATSIVRVASR
jgi:GDP-mannose 6-dehydrogenase